MFKQFSFVIAGAALIGGAFFATKAEASRARLISLGQAGPVVTDGTVSLASNTSTGQHGTASLYIDDQRSIFLNPAYLAKYAPFANFEMGSPTTGSIATPNAEGGVFLSRGDLKYGLQLGRESTSAYMVTAINTIWGLTGTGAIGQAENGVEAIVAGGGAMKWGAALFYATTDNKSAATTSTAGDPNKKGSALEARAGIMQDKFTAYGKLLLFSNGEVEAGGTPVAKYDGKPGLEAGGTFDLNADQRVWATLGYYTFTARQTAQGTADRDGGLTFLSAGFTQFWNPESITRLFVSGGFTMNNQSIKGTGATAEYKMERIYLPVVVGVENQATDWMIVRASVRQNILFDQTKNTNTTDLNAPNTTVVAVGPGFRWKRLTLDGVLAASTTGNVGSAPLMANAGLTYVF